MEIKRVRIGPPYKNVYNVRVTPAEVDILFAEDESYEVISGTEVTESLIACSIDSIAGVGPGAHKPKRIDHETKIATYDAFVRNVDAK
ncbi:MAG: hypothetical protein UR39_C0003G0002 [Candidatus Woesebacteria bacterium GW2011_GWA1_33_30]|uniref:Uncharacterized protein n=1 Tax=Candidatus Woesebacteria bacterium GW2011_GWA2_33_28 TaxID=1618561 RepID=A0A0G0CW63_9BACT|nr:MAG: hypothetical protein UR38_C0003G0002 [Candidatus Woesebacteria bacterium GW2011_GWA2_33_28]KKP48467.1 MAG: hypothetical protein UR39_C0003G0002 [Candidatus Woesebacteria bacterium GW2011_GWA1_33_30]KKP49603.1 MAG: hypothetical protein UR40_C0004G0002 [Microgenomates group bacterium GW2011_GWC1_33_32]KKP52220.1 MAG: hypothetical protein UR44_C0003G0002 [Candidatus Woesebacteria bacterium GW2011_GWB1_33_38]KKP55874.1 MAG: hypothetical protein UR48_C0047G0001 [Microgenomates group bacteriu